MKLVKWAVLALGLSITGSAVAEGGNVERYDGIAETPSGEFLYRERHEVTEVGGKPERALTVYYDRAGKEIARLSSDFRGSPYAPTYRFTDARNGKQESVDVRGRSVQVDYRGEKKSLGVPADETLVVGQGLHHFVRLNLARLSRETLTVRFAVPSRFDTYTFRVRPLDSPSPGVVRLRIEIDSWLMRQLAPNIEVDYELATRRLLRYRGVSNLEASDGSTQKVIIRYTYPRGAR